MKLAIIGSRNLNINITSYIPPNTTEIVSGGAKGIDSKAKEFALNNKIKYTEFIPEYAKFKKAAPLKRNEQIVLYSDTILAFWDGKSKGTKYAIDYAKYLGKNLLVITCTK